MYTHNERGVAIILALFLMTALSVLAASLMFLAQTETYATMNYRMMSQARYGAEAGVQKAANFLLTSYTTPPASGADPLVNYNTTVSPVTYNGTKVVLSAKDATCTGSNYPVAAVQTAFCNAVKGTMAAGNTSVKYNAYATLITMQQFASYGGATQVVQTWEITADGGLSGPRSGTVEVVAMLESNKVPTHGYAAFGTNPGCGSVKLTNGSTTNSYDSAAYGGSGTPALENADADVGTNGNLTESSGTTVYGTLATPRTGVGTCSNGNVTAETASGGASVSGGIKTLPQAVSMPTPAPPSPVPPTTANTYTTGTTTLDPSTSGGVITLGNVDIENEAVVHLKAGTYNVNSLSMNSGYLYIDSGPVIINVAGQGQTYPVNLSGGDIINNSFIASNLQIQYGGTANIILRAGDSNNGVPKNAQMIYMPNAAVTFSQEGDFFGSIVANTISDSGGGGIKLHYDRQLNSTFYVAGNAMLLSFAWKKF